MRDVVVIVMTTAFFAVCVAYVRLCDRIVGPDPAAGVPATGEQVDSEQVEAPRGSEVAS